MMKYIICILLLVGFMLTAQSFGINQQPDTIPKTIAPSDENGSDHLIRERQRINRHQSKADRQFYELKNSIDSLPPLTE